MDLCSTARNTWSVEGKEANLPVWELNVSVGDLAAGDSVRRCVG